MQASTPSEPRLCVCHIFDEEWAYACIHSLRYLLLGLVDAAVETLLVMPAGRKLPTSLVGPTAILTYEQGNWLTRRAQARRIVARIRDRLAALKTTGPVIAHGFGPRSLPIAAEIISGRDGAVVLTLDGAESHALPHLGIKLEHPPTILAPTPPIARRLSTVHVAPRVEIAPLGVPAAERVAAFDDESAEIALVFAGRLTPANRIDLLLRALKRLLATQPNAMLFLAGKGPAEPALRQLADALGIATNVIFVGRVEPIRSVLRSADVFCIPHWDGRWCEEVIEAMAAGLAIVAPENGPIESLRHGHSALLFPESDEFRLADYLERMTHDRATARRLAAEAQNACRAEHQVSRMVQQHLAVYRSLASRGKTLKLDTNR